MIARDAALLMHLHHHGGSAIPASQMDGKISTAGSYRAIYRQYAHTSPFFFALAASRPPADLIDQINVPAENPRSTSLTTVLTSSKIGSQRGSMRPDRGDRIALCGLQLRALVSWRYFRRRGKTGL